MTDSDLQLRRDPRILVTAAGVLSLLGVGLVAREAVGLAIVAWGFSAAAATLALDAKRGETDA